MRNDVEAVGVYIIVPHSNRVDWSIASGGTKPFTVTFSPVAAIGYSDTLTLVSDDPDESNYQIVLRGEGINTPPNPATLLSPTGSGASLTPTLVSSAFDDPDAGDTHQATRWRIEYAFGADSTPVWETTVTAPNLTSISVPAGALRHGISYLVLIYHQDNFDAWSERSGGSFSTLSATDLGTIQFFEKLDDAIDGEAWYQGQASQAGFFTAEALFAHAAGDINLELYNDQLQRIDSSTSNSDRERVEVYAQQGETYYLRVLGTNSDVDFRVANLVAQNGARIEVDGTSEADNFSFTAGTSHAITVNGVAYDFASAAITSFTFNGSAGYDSIVLTGTAGDETTTSRVGEVNLIGNGYTVSAVGVDNSTVHGGGGYDTANLYDSVNDDIFTVGSGNASLRGNGFDNRVNAFSRVNGYATAGGYDKVEFYDTAGDDTFTARPDENDAFMMSPGIFSYAKGFERVNAYATSGGYDKLEFYDTAADDTMTFRPEENDAFMFTGGVFSYGQGFDRYNAFATSGGYDKVEFFDTAADDTFTVRPEEGDAFLHAGGIFNYSVGFERVNAYATAGGHDTVEFYDTSGDDTFTVRPDQRDAFLNAAGIFNYAVGFERVNAYATAGGYDKVEFYDTIVSQTFCKRQQ